jgi:predicted metal-dependent hydrolase
MMINSATAMSLTSKQFYQYGTKKVEYYLIRTKRRKTSEIIVDEKEITVRVPFDKPIYEIEKLLASKIRWILEKQNQYIKKEEIIQIANLTFLQNSTLPYLGQNYKIKVIYENDKNYFFDNNNDNDRDKIEFKDDTFVITFSKEKNTVKNYLKVNLKNK